MGDDRQSVLIEHLSIRAGIRVADAVFAERRKKSNPNQLEVHLRREELSSALSKAWMAGYNEGRAAHARLVAGAKQKRDGEVLCPGCSCPGDGTSCAACGWRKDAVQP